MSNIKKAFEKGKAFIPFITCGDPSIEVTEQIVYAMEKSGADMIELGIPFSDPTAEGTTIQAANLRALTAGVTTDKIFDMVEKIRHNTLIKGYEYIVKSERKKAMDSIENAWNKYDESQVEKIMEYNEGYKNYISVCKTERECVRETIRQAEEKGYRDLKKVIEGKEILKAGDKVYYNNMDKALALFVVGEQPLEKGMKILGAHIDSPRIDLKQNPLYEDTEQVLLDTHYYGGIKKYQWVALPLALHGVVVKKDGTKVEIVIGEEEGDPVVGISDLLVHLSREQMEKKASKVIEGEDLNILIGSIPLKDEKKDAVKANIKKLLKEKYDIEEEDFISAEIEAVPAGRARDFGIDKSMVMGYGHDDRVCAYTSYTAMFEIENPDRTCVCLLVDKEEIGSTGATGMESKFLDRKSVV